LGSARIIARRERVNVALDLQRFAHVGAHHAQQVLVHRAFARERHDRDRQAFFEHLPAVRSHTEAADVDDVHRAGEQADRAAVEERGRDHREIVQMSAGEPRVVGDVMVARAHAGERINVEEMLDRVRHGVDVAGRAGHRLRQHAALTVEHAGREIACLAHRGAERGAHQGLRLLLDHRDQAAPHDLGVNLGKRGVRAGNHAGEPSTSLRLVIARERGQSSKHQTSEITGSPGQAGR
jgi:hypothetical protein